MERPNGRLTMADHLLLLPSPAQREKSSEDILRDIQAWTENMYETASITMKGTEEAFAAIVERLLDYEAVRIEEGLWPSRAGQIEAKAVDLWYQAERAYLHKKGIERASVKWVYTEDDSDVEDDDDEDDDDEVRTTA